MLINIILCLKSKEQNKDQQRMITGVQSCDTISNLLNDASIIDAKLGGFRYESQSKYQSFQLQHDEFLLLKQLAQNVENHSLCIIAVQDFCIQEVSLVNEKFEQRKIPSFDGTIMWKVTDVQEKHCLYFHIENKYTVLLNSYLMFR